MSNLIFDSALYGTVGFIPYPVAPGASEALEFLTDVLPSYTNATEERNQMRALPRQSIQYSYDSSFGYMQEIYNAIWKNIRGKWLIPLWFECQSVALTAGQTDIAVDTLLHDLRADSHALLFKNSSNWQVVTISAITDTSITCDASTIEGRALVIPFRVGFFSGQSAMTPTGYKNTIKASYYIDDVLSGLTESVTQYNGLDLYTVPYDVDNGGSVQVVFNEDQLEFGTGGIDHSTAWYNAQYSKQYAFNGYDIAAYRNLKNYFYRRAGRFRSFYSPTFESNLQNRSTGTVGTVLKFADEGYTDNLYALRKILGFRLTDGSWQIRNVTAVTHLGGGEDQLTLNAALNVPAERIAYISFVAKNRLDSDRLEIRLSQNSAFSASVNVMELTP